MLGWYRKYQSKGVLAVLFFSHLIHQLFFFWKPRKGLRRFLANYAQDAITTVSQHERTWLPSYERCQNCSLCTFSCEGIQQGKGHPSFEPKMLMLGYGRSSHESEYFLEDWVPCIECGECTVQCPNQVPIHAMLEEIRDRRSQLGFRR